MAPNSGPVPTQQQQQQQQQREQRWEQDRTGGVLQSDPFLARLSVPSNGLPAKSPWRTSFEARHRPLLDKYLENAQREMAELPQLPPQLQPQLQPQPSAAVSSHVHTHHVEHRNHDDVQNHNDRHDHDMQLQIKQLARQLEDLSSKLTQQQQKEQHVRFKSPTALEPIAPLGITSKEFSVSTSVALRRRHSDDGSEECEKEEKRSKEMEKLHNRIAVLEHRNLHLTQDNLRLKEHLAAQIGDNKDELLLEILSLQKHLRQAQRQIAELEAQPAARSRPRRKSSSSSGTIWK
jgi:hypothetical protein